MMSPSSAIERRSPSGVNLRVCGAGRISGGGVVVVVVVVVVSGVGDS